MMFVASVPARAGSDEIAAAALLAPRWTGGVIGNAAFVPGPTAAAAHEPFAGTLVLGEAEMTTVPAKFTDARILGRDPHRFPAVDLAFITDQGDLVPVTQDVIRAGSAGRGRSFWDVIVQPGRVWSVPADGDWSRAAFPFALVNSIEGETHNGLATFLYRNGKVSNLRFQIVQQTAPFYVKDHFTAAGSVPARFRPLAGIDRQAVAQRYEAALADAVPIAGWDDLAAKVGAAKLEGFDGSAPDTVLSGLDYGGTFYLRSCASADAAAGPLPWCDRARFGVWSATKALANATALLRLAQKYGAEIFELKIADYVPQAAGAAAWRDVRFGDAINMATGIGDGSAKRDPNDINDGYLAPGYARWYEARSVADKVAAIIRTSRRYPWPPGQVARYRDQDMFMLGVAMDGFLKAKEGPKADLWSMLEREVFRPIGIHDAPINRTIEPGGKPGQPLMAFGYYPTIGDIVKLARLYQAGGMHDGVQLLYRPRIEALLPGTALRGLPTGERLQFGETTYFTAFWEERYDSPDGCKLFIPRMLGWGGNMVALMPGGLTGIRLAHSDSDDPAVVDTTGMAVVANRLVPFCR
ncbi:MAG: serine hydrolase [Aliidongia sp.]